MQQMDINREIIFMVPLIRYLFLSSLCGKYILFVAINLADGGVGGRGQKYVRKQRGSRPPEYADFLRRRRCLRVGKGEAANVANCIVFHPDVVHRGGGTITVNNTESVDDYGNLYRTDEVRFVLEDVNTLSTQIEGEKKNSYFGQKFYLDYVSINQKKLRLARLLRISLFFQVEVNLMLPRGPDGVQWQKGLEGNEP